MRDAFPQPRLVWRIVLAFGLSLLLGACNAQPKNDMVSVGITGIDHLADHLSVQNFWVDGYNAFRAGKGSGEVCCAMLPKHWRPSLTVEVRWHIDNWRHKTYSLHQATVPVEKYDEAGSLYVHFLVDGSVRVVSSNYYPEGANHPDSKYPVKIPIPDKDPWHKYSIGEGDPPFTQVPNAMQEIQP